MVWEIGATAKFNCTPEENSARMQRFESWIAGLKGDYKEYLPYTMLIIKPEAEGRESEAKTDLDSTGLGVVYSVTRRLSREVLERLYAEHFGKIFYEELMSFMASRPVTIMVLTRTDGLLAYISLRGILGPSWCESGLRQKYGHDGLKNGLHASDSLKRIKEEIAIVLDAQEQALVAQEMGLRQAMPLEFLNESRVEGIARTGLAQTAISHETELIRAFPALVAQKYGPAHEDMSLIYALGYFGKLTAAQQSAVVAELESLGQGSLASWLKENNNKTLSAQVEAVSVRLGNGVNKEELINFVELHDKAVARARGVRVGLETDEGDLTALADIAGNQGLLEVVLGLRSAAVVGDLRDRASLEHALWSLRQIQGVWVNIVELPNGTYYAYDEYALKDLAAEEGLTIGVTRQGLEHLIKIDMVKGAGLFVEAASVANTDNRITAGLRSSGIGILQGMLNARFTSWDATDKIFRAESLAVRTFEIERSPIDTTFIGTGMRPEALRVQLTAEMENWRIFNTRSDLVVIDGSDMESPEVFARDRALLGDLSQRYGVRALHLDVAHHWNGDIARLRDCLVAKYNAELEAGTLDAQTKEILTQRGVMDAAGKVDAAKMLGYLNKNVFRHISGLRNYTVLLGAGDGVIMNIDDDAPPETYVLFKGQRAEIMSRRENNRAAAFAKLLEEVSARLEESITDAAGYYRALADPAKREKLADLEAKYFAYDSEHNKGLIPQAMEEIKKRDEQYLDRITENDRVAKTKPGLASKLRLTHQRYQSLMTPLPKYLVTVSDFVYTKPRGIKQEGAFKVLPVNTHGAARLLNKTVKESRLPIREKDLRGTSARPVSDQSKRAAMQKKRIVYVAYPFILDQDTSAIAQLMRYLEIEPKIAANLQHTNQMALILGGISGFAADTYVIFNRAALINLVPMPSIGRDLRLEEPPYIVWVSQPVSLNTITMCYSPVAGGQQRSIGERLYIIAGQDFTETVGGVARRTYEKAVRNFYRQLKTDKVLQEVNNFLGRIRALGNHYIEAGKSYRLSKPQVQNLRKQRQVRAILTAELGRQRGVKYAQLQALEVTEATAAERASLDQQIRDMDLIQVHFTNSFHLYRFKKEADPTKAKHVFYRAEAGNYLYEIRVEGDRIYWDQVEADFYVSEVGGISSALTTSWKKTGVHDSVLLSTWESGRWLELETGRQVYITELPKAGEVMIAPAVAESMEAAYLKEIETKAGDQIKSDGELIYLWPDLLPFANNWRNDYHATDPNAQVIATNTTTPPDHYLVRPCQR